MNQAWHQKSAVSAAVARPTSTPTAAEAFHMHPRNAPHQVERHEQQGMQQRPTQASQYDSQYMQRSLTSQAYQHEPQHMQRPYADQDLQQQPQHKAHQHELQQQQRLYADQAYRHEPHHMQRPHVDQAYQHKLQYVQQPPADPAFALHPQSVPQQVEHPKQQSAPPRQNADKARAMHAWAASQQDKTCVVSLSKGTMAPVFTRSLDILPNVSLDEEDDYGTDDDDGPVVSRVSSLCCTAKPRRYSRACDQELFTKLNSHIQRLEQ